jgi:hypothetical protein
MITNNVLESSIPDSNLKSVINFILFKHVLNEASIFRDEYSPVISLGSPCNGCMFLLSTSLRERAAESSAVGRVPAISCTEFSVVAMAECKH